MKYRILQVVEWLGPEYMGSAQSVIQMSRALAKRGHEVTIFASDYKLDRSRFQSVPEVQIQGFKIWLSLANFEFTPAIIDAARKELANYDVVHMHNYRTFQNIVIHHYAKKNNIPYLLQARGSVATFFQKGRLKKIYDRLWGYSILKDASKLLALSPEEKKQYMSMGVSEDKVAEIPNGIDVSVFSELPPKGEFRKKYAFKDDEQILFFLGRINWIKGLDLLADAFAIYSKINTKARLVIAGPDDGFLSALKKQIAKLEIEDRISIIGPLYGRDKIEAYVDSDIYVLPSAYETFPNTVLEACACNTPVVVTDRCQIAHIVDGNIGIVAAHDKYQLSNAFARLLGNDELRDKLVKKCGIMIRKQFSWSEIAKHLENIYGEVMNQH